jgi:hypothetical protein
MERVWCTLDVMIRLLFYLCVNSWAAIGVAQASDQKSVLIKAEPGNPDFTAPKLWFVCNLNEDCVAFKDACRGCYEPIALNKKHEKKFRDLYYEKLASVKTCEAACLANDAKALCFKNLCTYR